VISHDVLELRQEVRLVLRRRARVLPVMLIRPMRGWNLNANGGEWGDAVLELREEIPAVE